MARNSGSCEIVADATLAAFETNPASLPAAWGAKALYLGETGARHWLDVAHSRSGTACGEPEELQRRRLNALDEIAVGTYVSLGPGDGLHDIEIIRHLKLRNPRVRYVPIDISSELLSRAVENLASCCHVPVGIQCDFEVGQEFLKGALAGHKIPPALFALLGGTFGNLDLSEESFFRGMRELLGADDLALIEVPLAGPGWTPQTEPRLNPASYGPAFLRFLGGPGAAEGEAAVTPFEKRFELRLEGDDLVGSKTIVVADRQSGRSIRNRRYQLDRFLSWLPGQGLTIRFLDHVVSHGVGNLGMGWLIVSAGGSAAPRQEGP
jgi:hypothetical protein